MERIALVTAVGLEVAAMAAAKTAEVEMAAVLAVLAAVMVTLPILSPFG